MWFQKRQKIWFWEGFRLMMHTLKLDDMELTALITHLEGQSEMMVESRLNCSNPSELPDREEVLLNLVYAKAFTIGWDADKDPNNDFNLIKNQDRIYQNKLYPQVYGQTKWHHQVIRIGHTKYLIHI